MDKLYKKHIFVSCPTIESINNLFLFNIKKNYAMFIKQTRERKRKIESERERFKGNNSHSVLDSLFDDRLLYS